MTTDRSVEAEDGQREHAPPVRPNYVGAGFLVIMIAVGIAYVSVAVSYGLSADTNPLGPGAAPAALGILLIVGCLVLLAQEVLAYRRGSAEAAPGIREAVKPITILLILVVGLMLAPILGMLVAMPLAVVAIALLVEKLKIVPALIMGAVTALMLWLVFQQLLSVRFPNSLIGL
ncbi:tripartite tricarboxylate transporter TctB family protein [Citricoccus sp. GCM10030269]|uniref:tripartite tricarboxylate transporter TctB family protein n=1 Tax=Citricoccus sp. GCM10030269 TaxID=3273388 RepID=UPI0036084753